jgi:hypothetical protein
MQICVGSVRYGWVGLNEKLGQTVMQRMGKHFVFRNYWRIAPVVALALIAIIAARHPQGWESLTATTLGGALAFCYFVQKQKLDELRLFKDLFTDFNRRYDAMNEKLENIRAGNQRVDPQQRKILANYFNLCAEEYLFFNEGYIHGEVWSSWCRGMLYYLHDARILQVWNEEMVSDSYYSLTLDTIKKGASTR